MYVRTYIRTYRTHMFIFFVIELPIEEVRRRKEEI